ncbi:MAG: hypothetical protein LC749_14335, partial [Actinobacteria bacterium]|nr:hypothetical protein [Actinomycetota bacterium]
MTLVIQGGSRAVAVRPPDSLPSRFRPLARREALRSEQYQWRRDQNLAWHAQDVLAGLGLARSAAGAVSFPHVTHVDYGPPTALTVRTLPGQVAADYLERAGRIAANLGVAKVRVVAVNRRTVLLELLDTDPLADTVELPDRGLASPYDLLLM